MKLKKKKLSTAQVGAELLISLKLSAELLIYKGRAQAAEFSNSSISLIQVEQLYKKARAASYGTL